MRWCIYSNFRCRWVEHAFHWSPYQAIMSCVLCIGWFLMVAISMWCDFSSLQKPHSLFLKNFWIGNLPNLRGSIWGDLAIRRRDVKAQAAAPNHTSHPHKFQAQGWNFGAALGSNPGGKVECWPTGQHCFDETAFLLLLLLLFFPFVLPFLEYW